MLWKTLLQLPHTSTSSRSKSAMVCRVGTYEDTIRSAEGWDLTVGEGEDEDEDEAAGRSPLPTPSWRSRPAVTFDTVLDPVTLSLSNCSCLRISSAARSTCLERYSFLAMLSACLATVVTMTTGGVPSAGGGTGEE